MTRDTICHHFTERLDWPVIDTDNDTKAQVNTATEKEPRMITENQGKANGYVGVGRLAEMLGVSPTTVREWEAAGVVPVAGRIEPRSQRVWPTADLESIRERVAAKRAAARQHGDSERVA